jgi:transposase
MSNNENGNEPRKKRRKLSAEKKYQILEEVKTNPGKMAEILRREGLYRSDLIRFRNAAKDGAIKSLKEMTPGRKKVKEVPLEDYEKLRKELEQKEKALADLSVDFMIFKKKVNGE